MCRVTQTVQYIRGNSPKTQIVLLGVLPRGAQYWDKDQAWIWPNRYTDAIAAVNAGYYVSPRALLCPTPSLTSQIKVLLLALLCALRVTESVLRMHACMWLTR